MCVTQNNACECACLAGGFNARSFVRSDADFLLVWTSAVIVGDHSSAMVQDAISRGIPIWTDKDLDNLEEKTAMLPPATTKANDSICDDCGQPCGTLRTPLSFLYYYFVLIFTRYKSRFGTAICSRRTLSLAKPVPLSAPATSWCGFARYAVTHVLISCA